MRQHSFRLFLATGLLLMAAVQTVKAQMVVLHKTDGQTIECSVTELDSITFTNIVSHGVNPVVLLEDFTGQRCTNCPRATEVIEQLQETYGNNIVAVGIHGGPLAFAGNAKSVGLKTTTGDEYYNHWNLEYQPVGLVNRHFPVFYTEWAAAVKEELAKPAPLRLSGTAVLADSTINIQINAEGVDGIVTGKMQVWLIEDSIQTLQLMPDGTINQEYIHNHVFRTAVNGTWGEDYTVSEGETAQRTMTQVLQPDWNSEHLSIVAFFYNDGGVQQTTKFDVNKAPFP